MDGFAALMTGFETALTPINLMWSLVGVTLGTLIGMLPGIGPALTIALLFAGHRQARPDRRLHHVRRALLRCHVRLVDHLHPA